MEETRRRKSVEFSAQVISLIHNRRSLLKDESKTVHNSCFYCIIYTRFRQQHFKYSSNFVIIYKFSMDNKTICTMIDCDFLKGYLYFIENMHCNADAERQG